MAFEDIAVDYFSDGIQMQRVLTNSNVGDLRNRVKDTISMYKSPFAEAAIWIKGEMLDIQGMIDAMKGREKVMKMQIDAEGKRRENQGELEDLSLGKTTLTSFWKSKSSKDKDILNLQAKIEQGNVDIENYRKLVNFITIYHGQMAIDKFKKHKIHQYTKMLQGMSTRSIHNAYLNATLNALVLETFEKI